MFFHHIIFAMCDVGRYGIRVNPRKSYYCEVEKFLNIYIIKLGLDGSYGTNFVNMYIDELVK